MNELESKMADILKELKQPYTEQYKIGYKTVLNLCSSEDYCPHKSGDDYWGGNIYCHSYNVCYEDQDCDYYTNEFIPKYILDFAVFINNKSICIECDGFEFHRATDWQVLKDIERDKYLRDQGWIIKRFAGVTIVNHKNRIKKELKELFDSLQPKQSIQKLLI